jgi:type VI secretion system secreted protein Hcp
MAFDAFIKIDDIDGESNDAKHSGWIEIRHYSFNENQKISKTVSSAGGATAERVSFSNFHFSKFIDKSTPKLSLACAAGTHIDNVVIELCRAGGGKMKFMEYRLSNCLISKVKTEAIGRLRIPIDVIYIDFGKIQIAYTQQSRKNGTAMGNVVTGWDLQRNCKI